MQLNFRSPKTQKAIIGCTLLFGLSYAYINFAYIPRSEKAKKLVSDIKRERDLLNRGKRIAANYQTVQEDHARLMKSWEIAHQLLPTQREMEDLLKGITLAGQDHDITFVLFKPLDPVEKPYYWENPIQIKTVSSYHDLGSFLSEVACMDRIVNVNSLKLSNHKVERGYLSQTVEAEFVASIYIFKELGAPVTTAEEAAKAAKNAAPKATETTPGAKKPAGKEKEKA